MKEKKKPKYNMWQNTCFMIQRAAQYQKRILAFAALQAALGVCSSLLELFVTPAVLDALETVEKLSALLFVIAFFSLGLIFVNGAKGYIDANTMLGRANVRLMLTQEINGKLCTTSYPNTERPDFLERSDKAFDAVYNNQSSAELIWSTLVELSKNGICLALWTLLLAGLNPFLVAVTFAVSIIDYFATAKIGHWGYVHRDEEAKYTHALNYVTEKTKDYRLAKDLRIFGLGSWLEDCFESALRLFRNHKKKGEKVYLWADVLRIALTFVRNGIAYAWLIFQVTVGALSAAEFVLYFTALGGFTVQVAAILNQLVELHRQSLDLSLIREYLEEEEPFLFEEGKALPVYPEKPCAIALENVSFFYPEAQEATLKHINLTIREGEKLALVGLNGAGKTTLIKLICGFYDPTEGSVRLNGEDIRQYNRRDYYKHFSAVFQKFSVMAGSIAENVAQSADGGGTWNG